MKKARALLSFNPTTHLPFSFNSFPFTYSTSSLISILSNQKNQHSAATLPFSSTSNSPFLGSQIHAQTTKIGLSKDTFTQNNLLVMYTKCGLLHDALKVFDEMTERNLVSWTSMISGFIRNNEWEMGMNFCVEMLRFGFCPNEFALASVLAGCVEVDNVGFGYLVHAIALKIGLDGNCFVGGSLLRMYAKCGDVGLAELLFEGVEHQDLGCWNALVEAYASNDRNYNAMSTVSIIYRNGLIMDQFTFISSLKACSTIGDLNYVQQLHCLISCYGFELCTTVMNALGDAYFGNGLHDSAFEIFCSTNEKDIVSWNTVLSGFAQEEDHAKVVNLFSGMLASGLRPNRVTFSIILRMCGAMDDPSVGLQICCLACHLGFFSDTLVVNSLISMFCKYGFVKSANIMFKSAPNKNTITWNEMIAGCSSHCYAKEALQLFSSLIQLGFEADEYTYSTIFGAFQGPQFLKACYQIHANVLKSGFSCSCVVGSAMINAYARSGSVESCLKIFQALEILDLVAWGTMVSAFSKQGLSSETLFLINCLRGQGENPDEFILASALNACANTAAFEQCRCIHAHTMKTGYEKHLCVGSALIDTYAKCGNIGDSKLAFDDHSSKGDAVLFNAMITAFAHHGLVMEAMELFQKMRHANIYPSHATFVAVISTCNHFGLVEEGQLLFNSISSDYGICPSKDNFSCLIDLLARNGLLDKARDVIECMPFEPWPSVWRSLLNGARIHGDKRIAVLAAERVFQLMPDDDGAHVLLANVYAEDGRWEDAEMIRMRIKEKGLDKVPGFSKIEI